MTNDAANFDGILIMHGRIHIQYIATVSSTRLGLIKIEIDDISEFRPNVLKLTDIVPVYA